jgi:uncharacterized iron-regulated membrane protein
MKKSLQWLHRWIGLSLGLVLTLICLSGASLLFHPQFFRWAHGDLFPAVMSPRIGSIDAWVKSANAAVPALGSPLYIWVPQTSHNISDAGMVLYRDAPSGFGKLGLTAVLVAPSSGEVLGVVNIDRSPAYAPIFLHGRLWAGKTGLVVAAFVSVGSFVLVLIGLYLWWPPRRYLVKKLSARPLKNTFLYAGRLHDWSGAWTLPLLLMVAFTGVYMARADWLEPLLRLLPGESPHHAHVEMSNAPERCTGSAGFDTIVSKAQAMVPGAVLSELRATGKNSWQLALKPRDSVAGTSETHLIANLDCGTVAVVGSPQARAPRDTTELLLHGLHDGTLFGLPGQIFMTLVGLIPLLLAWTGMSRWLRGRAAARRSAATVV